MCHGDGIFNITLFVYMHLVIANVRIHMAQHTFHLSSWRDKRREVALMHIYADLLRSAVKNVIIE